jgi:GT2 family glycosyltransferase
MVARAASSSRAPPAWASKALSTTIVSAIRGSSSAVTQASVISAMSAETITTSTIGSGSVCSVCASMTASLPSRAAEDVALTVAVLSYDGRHLLEVILPSLALQRFRDFEVVVVDNGSRDDTAVWLGEHWPEVEVISLPDNVGVTAALNVCARAGRGELVGLFNNDLELEPDCLGEMVHALRAHPAAGWSAAKLRDFEHRELLDGAGDVFTWAATGGRRGHGEPDRGQYDRPREIFGACGGAAIYRRGVLAQVGEFDEDFFAFYEDVDWNLRAQLAGFKCRYVPTAVVYHMGSATIGRGLSDFTRYHLWRNTLWIVAKDIPARALLRHAHQLALGQLLNLAVAIRDRKLGIWLRVWRDALRGLPRMLRKRRAVQARRTVSLSQLEAVVGTAEES